jgi:heme-degrading monooxygenase HmoA
VGEADAHVSVVSVLRVPVTAEGRDRLAGAYRTLGVFERARQSGGFQAGRLLRPLADGEPFLVVAEWDDAAAYERWLDNPARAELAAELEPLLSGALEGAMYEEVHAG